MDYTNEQSVRTSGRSEDGLPVIIVKEVDLQLVWPLAAETKAEIVNSDGK